MKSKMTFTIGTCLLVWVLILMGAIGSDFDISSPAGSDDPRDADNRMREIKQAVQERMNDYNGNTDEGDHYWPMNVDGVNVDDTSTGQHRMVTLRQMAADPSGGTGLGIDGVVDLGFLFQKDVSENGELFWEDEAGSVIRMTDNGRFGGDKTIQVENAAPELRFYETDGSFSGGAASIRLLVGTDTFYIQEADPTDDNTYNNIFTIPNDGNIALGAKDDTTFRQIKNVLDPTADQDVATKVYVDGSSDQAVGTSNITNITGDWADMADMEITFTPKNGSVLLMFSANIKSSGGDGEWLCRFDIDGSPYHQMGRPEFTNYENLNIEHVMAMQYLITGLSAASHTFKVQWKDIADTVQQNGATYPRVFTAIDI